MPNDTPEPDPQFEKVCAILESIDKMFPEGSEQRRAIREAAKAYAFVQSNLSLKETIEAFRQGGPGVLTGKAERLVRLQEEYLREVGLSPAEVSELIGSDEGREGDPDAP